eukprot:CAMPEP_0194747220 /NCGR_PEP_ID=MMETSP0323_2-20130528/1287_1 /TAXON_ID=2866 ORGANISM="Crypthecodinium cohnii, Strain Seligo" /NCGR_SAMPLE_ID=MMETSP0323_2 /ASSEMBLY_ACC=CAM_ASM_000346 /LENGTH=39 /DNA_ID= /DNA_START= /DNA_END= /DNA_ORIENTATION=
MSLPGGGLRPGKRLEEALLDGPPTASRSATWAVRQATST